MYGPVLAWGLSLLPLAAEALFGLDVPGARELSLVALPWIALAGVPRGSGERKLPAWKASFFWTALALPPLGFAAALDE